MQHTRLLALDIGTKRTGVAISDWSGLLATPYSVLPSQNRKALFQAIQKIIKDEEIQAVIVGMPLNQDGEIGRDAALMKKHVEALRLSVDVPVIEWDERYTTVEAERMLLERDYSRQERKQVIDKVAAGILLQSYLDFQRSQDPERDVER